MGTEYVQPFTKVGFSNFKNQKIQSSLFNGCKIHEF